jgi:hypothetical protein
VLARRELQRKGLGLWRGDEAAEGDGAMEEDGHGGASYLDVGPRGLFPSVVQCAGGGKGKGPETTGKRVDTFRFLGR